MKTRKAVTKSWNFPKKLFRLFLVFIMALYIQLCYLTLSPTIYGKDMKEFARNRNTVKTTLNATRGSILDRDGNNLAINVSTYTVLAYLSESRTTDPEYPHHVVDKEMTAEKLSPIINMTKEDILSLLQRDVYQVELGPGGRGISELVKDEIKALDLPGIDFIETVSRNYPNGDFASYIIGYAKRYDELITDPFTGKERVDYKIVGELGIEAKYDKLLSGTDGYLEYQRDQSGYRIPDTKEIRIDPENGANIYLTLDSNIQRFAETAVKEASEKYKPEWLMIHVMDAKTGEILASASTPSYNPNILNITNYNDPLVSYAFEPGSTMKTYTYMCAIDKGKYDGNATFLSGTYEIGDDVVNDWNGGRGFGWITYDNGFLYSSNVGIANIMQNYISRNDLKECLEKYGFGDTTGIELSREFTGSINFTYPIEVAAAGFGQGITTTPIQQLQGLSIIANHGKKLTPYIVSKIVDPNTGEIIYQGEKKESEQLVKESTIEKMKDLMYQVVHSEDPNATGYLFRVDGFDVIAKTGTAQIYENGGYLGGDMDYIWSFAGMYPKDDPEVILYVSVKKPSWAGKSSIVDATKFMIESIAKYRNMFAPDQEEVKSKSKTLGNYFNKDINQVKEELTNFGAKVIVIGDGTKITKQYPEKNTDIIVGDKVFLLTNGINKAMPNLTGFSKTDVEVISNYLGIPVEYEGYGYVVNQSIPEGTIITNDLSLKVVLQEKYHFKEEEKKQE